MKRLVRVLQGIAGTLAGACFGNAVAAVLDHFGLSGQANATSWMIVLGGFNGAVMATCGWKYWACINVEADYD